MNKSTEILKTLDKLDDLHEMANVGPEITGLKYTVHLDSPTEKSSHGARVKVSNVASGFRNMDNYIITVPNKLTKTKRQFIIIGTPTIASSEISKSIKWAKLNQDIIIKYWNSKGEMDISQLLKEIKSV